MTHKTTIVIAIAASISFPSATFAGKYKELDSVSGGTIKGTVKLSKPPPAMKKIPVTKDHRVCGKNVPDETYVVDKNHGFANVVVFIEKIRKGKKIGKRKATIDNKNCRFVPHVSAFPVGTQLFITNSDDTLHNAHSYIGDNKQSLFNIALPMKGLKVPKKMKRPGIVEFKCDAGHTWMHAWAYITEHPYVTTTDANGNFELNDVPAGKYKLVAWHEAEGKKVTDSKIVVAEGGEATVEIVF